MAETQVIFDTHQALFTYWRDHWDTADCLCIYENEVTEPPPNTAFIRFSVTFGNVNQVTVGNNPLERSNSRVTIQINVPSSTGKSKMLLLADKARNILRGLEILVNEVGGLIRFRVASNFTEVGEVNDESYYYGVVFAPFERDAYV
jgi:hypothetical protein